MELKLNDYLSIDELSSDLKDMALEQFISSKISYLIGDSKSTKRSENENRFSNASKNENISIGLLSFAPHKISGYDMCPHSGFCEEYCIGESGRSQNLGRIKRTIYYLESKKKKDEVFFNQLCIEISEHIKNSFEEKKDPVFRLNGYSDIKWEDEKYC